MAKEKYNYQPISDKEYNEIKMYLIKFKSKCMNILTEKEFYCLLSYFRCSEIKFSTDIFSYSNIPPKIREKQNIDDEYEFIGCIEKKLYKLHSTYSAFPKSLINKFNKVGFIYYEVSDKYNFYKDYYIDWYNLMMFLSNNSVVSYNELLDKETLDERLTKNEYPIVQYLGEGGEFYEAIDDLYEARKNGRQTKKYKEFEQAVLERDNCECQICGSKNNPQVHHILPYKTHKKLRTDVDNGITLCEMHHSPVILGGFHNKYGTYNNTPEQLQEYCDFVREELGLEPKIITNTQEP